MTSASASFVQPGHRIAPTKQWTRIHATKRLEEEVERANADPSYYFSILLIEFDGLGDTADRLGYAAEEDVWRRALGFLAQDMTAQDMCCRLSGDEFLLILPGKNRDTACDAMERLKRRWKPASVSLDPRLQVSIGTASYSATQGSTVEQLLRAADETLHADRERNEGLLAADLARTAAVDEHAKERRGVRGGWRRTQAA